MSAGEFLSVFRCVLRSSVRFCWSIIEECVCLCVCQGEHPPRAEPEEEERHFLHCASCHWTGEDYYHGNTHILIPTASESSDGPLRDTYNYASVLTCVCSGPGRSPPAAAPPGWPGQRGWRPTAEEPVHPDQSGDDRGGRVTVLGSYSIYRASELICFLFP